MPAHTTNYYDTLIEVADDCPVAQAEAPPTGPRAKSVARWQYELLHENPYRFTSDEVVFAVFAGRRGVVAGEREGARAAFFARGQPCLRASPLTKRYGWGVHADHEGRLALCGLDSTAYAGFVADEAVTKVRAMRSRRA